LTYLDEKWQGQFFLNIFGGVIFKFFFGMGEFKTKIKNRKVVRIV
jgi:hypothetical protein